MKTKDYISLGLLNALFIMLLFVLLSTVGSIPLVSLFFTVFLSLASGVIYLLLAVKIRKPGVFLLSAILQSLVLLPLFGFNIYMFLFDGMLVIGGLLAELAAKPSAYRSLKGVGAGFVLYMVCLTFGFWGPIYWLTKSYFTSLGEYGRLGELFADLSGWLVLIIIASTAIAAIAGYLFGIKLLNKHFRKAGLV
ncbi:MptD family putative ECF transporter S component [Paenibacillus sp. GCM10027627]|uniref:MptD family putative ECF transporter S component n=1 Tax=unclassified Paenibacillus TaxID=185978 RepID=UPI003630F094